MRQGCFWLLYPGAVIGTQTSLMNSVDWRANNGQFGFDGEGPGRTLNRVTEPNTRENTY